MAWTAVEVSDSAVEVLRLRHRTILGCLQDASRKTPESSRELKQYPGSSRAQSKSKPKARILVIWEGTQSHAAKPRRRKERWRNFQNSPGRPATPRRGS